jgi:hypothetical protein
MTKRTTGIAAGQTIVGVDENNGEDGTSERPIRNPYALGVTTVIEPGAGGTAETDTFVTDAILVPAKKISGKKVIGVLTVGAAMTSGESNTARDPAAATFTFDASTYGANDESYIVLTDVIGTSKTFIMRTAGHNLSYEINNVIEVSIGLSALATANNFIAAVNASALRMTATGNSSTGLVTLTQDDQGMAGNTAITIGGTGFNALCSVNPPTVFSAGASIDFFVEFSPDGTNWTHYIHGVDGTGISLLQDMDLTVAASKIIGVIDLEGTQAPYIRLGMNSAGRDLGTPLNFTMGFTYPKDYVRAVETEFWDEYGDRYHV